MSLPETRVSCRFELVKAYKPSKHERCEAFRAIRYAHLKKPSAKAKSPEDVSTQHTSTEPRAKATKGYNPKINRDVGARASRSLASK